MAQTPRDTGWFKSSRSGSGNDACVEVRIIAGGPVGVRDSKNRVVGALWIAPSAWATFINGIKV